MLCGPGDVFLLEGEERVRDKLAPWAFVRFPFMVLLSCHLLFIPGILFGLTRFEECLFLTLRDWRYWIINDQNGKLRVIRQKKLSTRRKDKVALGANNILKLSSAFLSVSKEKDV